MEVPTILQISSHLLECILVPSRYEMKYLIRLSEITDEMTGIIEYWENKG